MIIDKKERTCRIMDFAVPADHKVKLKESKKKKKYLELSVGWLVGWLVGFYGISTFVCYLKSNPFLCK